MDIRMPAVAGAFYPANPGTLQAELAELLALAQAPELEPSTVKALVVPHAGYIYSGPIAATAYRLLQDRSSQIRRVILLGPSHRVPFRGMAVPASDSFRTPLGDIPIDQEALAAIADLPGVQQRDDAHEWEHSLEVQLPFLQTVLDEFTLVPIVVGPSDPDTVAAVLEKLWGDEDTIILISSDLSHFLPYAQAQETDSETTRLIENMEPCIVGEQACGCYPLNGMLRLAKNRGFSIKTLDLRNSGDTAGDKDQVVGYGSYAICQ